MDLDLTKLPENLASVYILSFLVHHDWEDLAPALGNKLDDIKALAPDQHGIINLNVATSSFTIILPTITNNSHWTFMLPGTKFVDLKGVRGTLYTAPGAPLPHGPNKFWIQQYPSGIAGVVGRTVIEFYTDNILTAIFKTDVNNFGASGTGVWTP